jgi:hypothetical protein
MDTRHTLVNLAKVQGTGSADRHKPGIFIRRMQVPLATKSWARCGLRKRTNAASI